MTDPVTPDAGPLGEYEVELKIRYKDSDDLADHYQALADDARVGGKFLYNKPLWLVRLIINCCGGSPP